MSRGRQVQQEVHTISRIFNFVVLEFHVVVLGINIPSSYERGKL